MAAMPTTVPVIDFSEMSNPAKRSSICAQVAQACETVGFFEIVNSGIPREALDDAFDSSRDFYHLPMEEKLTLEPELGDKKPLVPVFQLGYKHFPVLGGVENRMEEMVFRHYHMQETGSLKDSLKGYTNGSSGEIDPTVNWWPSNPPNYRAKVQRLTVELGKVGDTLLDVFSESLGLPPTYLREEYHKNATVPRYLNFHHYPKGTKTDVDETGIIPHRDSSVFTIVSQGYDTEGLEINPYGEWIPVLPKRGGLVVNVGDILQAWTNGKYRSILHRVVSNRERGRHSFAYFLFPAPGPEADYIVQPIPKLITEANPPTYVPFSYLEFFKNKMRVNSVSLLQTHELQSPVEVESASNCFPSTALAPNNTVSHESKAIENKSRTGTSRPQGKKYEQHQNFTKMDTDEHPSKTSEAGLKKRWRVINSYSGC